MKFHCDRCKTRYSIADERVRGKILKIRCKNCSAVITVKEGGQVAATPAPAAAPARPAAAAAPAPARAKPQGASSPARPAQPSASSPAKAPAIPDKARGPQPSQAMRLGTNAPTPAARPGAVAQARASLPTRNTTTGSRDAGRGGNSGAISRSGSALQGAFAQALRRQPDPGPADSVSNAPATLDAEWYVSEDGDQFGPYELRQAQDWVSSRRADDELYCWSEGFDDWLPVEKVSHFRGLRKPSPKAAAPAAARTGPFDLGGDDQTVVDAPPEERNVPLHEDTPVPLFAATMAQIAADAPTEIEEENPFAGALKKKSSNGASARPGAARKPEPRPALPLPKSNPAPARPASQAAPSRPAPPVVPVIGEKHDDFEIGEASRVVKLPMLARTTQTGISRAAALPGVDAGGLGRGTGTFQQYSTTGLPIIQGGGTIDMPRPEILQPSRRAKSLAVPIAIAGAVLVGVIAVMIYLAVSGGDDEDENLARARLAGDGLAYNFIDENKDGKDDQTGQTVEEVKEAAKRGTARRVIKRNPREGSTTVGTAAGTSDEVDLGGGGGELDPDDLISVYQDNRIGVTLCYNSALKKDPLLRVQKVEVTIRVGTTGTVSMVSIPSLSGTELGSCLQKRIKAWRFPKNSSGLETRFPIIFDS